jgi:hypothetical protein
VVGAFKSISTIAVNRQLSRTGRRLLQEDYFEHVIRNVDSLEKIRDYIITNPARWQEDPETPVVDGSLFSVHRSAFIVYVKGPA